MLGRAADTRPSPSRSSHGGTREHRPASPVAGGECIEVRPERYLAVFRHHGSGARRGAQPPCADRRADDVERLGQRDFRNRDTAPSRIALRSSR
jgi:hypothetical protein